MFPTDLRLNITITDGCMLPAFEVFCRCHWTLLSWRWKIRQPPAYSHKLHPTPTAFSDSQGIKDYVPLAFIIVIYLSFPLFHKFFQHVSIRNLLLILFLFFLFYRWTSWRFGPVVHIFCRASTNFHAKLVGAPASTTFTPFLFVFNLNLEIVFDQFIILYALDLLGLMFTWKNSNAVKFNYFSFLFIYLSVFLTWNG